MTCLNGSEPSSVDYHDTQESYPCLPWLWGLDTPSFTLHSSRFPNMLLVCLIMCSFSEMSHGQWKRGRLSQLFQNFLESGSWIDKAKPRDEGISFP